MASRYFNQFISSLNFNPVYIEGSFKIGANGAVVEASPTGAGIPASSTLSIQQKSTGSYLLQLTDAYTHYLGSSFQIIAPTSGAQFADGSASIIPGKTYAIAASSALPFVQPGVTLGSTGTNWVTLGLPSDVTPYVGSPFVATSAASQNPGSSTQSVGTGWVSPIFTSGIDHVEMIPSVNLQLYGSSAIVFDNGPGQTATYYGSNLWFQTIKSSSAAPVNANTGTIIRYNLMLRNSSRGGFNESSSANAN